MPARARTLTEEAVWQHADDIARLARQLCQHREDAEDVAQTSLLKAAQHIHGFRGEASVRTWLHRITADECRMLRRKLTPQSLDAILERTALGAAGGRAAAEETSPEMLAEERALRYAVVAAVAMLPGRQRIALVLREGAQLSIEDVAERVGTTVPGVRSLLVRARRELRHRVTGDGPPPDTEHRY